MIFLSYIFICFSIGFFAYIIADWYVEREHRKFLANKNQ